MSTDTPGWTSSPGTLPGRRAAAGSFRALLFRDLHLHMRLTDEEKVLAHNVATNNLVNLLRAMPSPPVRVHTDAQVTKHGTGPGLRAEPGAWSTRPPAGTGIPSVHRGWRQKQVENAYSLRLRPSVDLLQQLALFCGSAAVPTVTGT